MAIHIINKYCADLLPSEIWENIEEINRYSIRHDVMKKVQQHKDHFQTSLNLIEVAGRIMLKHTGRLCFNMRKVYLFIDTKNHNVYKYRESDCYNHAHEYLNWCFWRMENTQDFYRKCQIIGDIKYLYYCRYNSFCILERMIIQKLKTYGVFDHCKNMANVLYNTHGNRALETTCICSTYNRYEDCYCKCHYNDSSDSDNTDTDIETYEDNSDIETDE